jgi:hypothetical protein
VKVVFDEATHTYTADGWKVPSVTEILGDLSAIKRMDPAWLAAARDRGQLVHKVIELHNQEDLDESTVDPSVAGYLTAWKRFCSDYKFKVLLSERVVWSDRWGFAGKFDVLGTWVPNRHGAKHWRFCLPEVKSGAKDPSHGPQTAAYVQAAVEMEILDELRRKDLPQRCAVYLKPDGYYNVDRFSFPQDWPIFLAALTCYRFKEKHGLL